MIRNHHHQIKLSISNNSDQNYGLWEAIRIPTDKSSRVPLRDEVNTCIYTSAANFIDQPSYSTGCLKDVHKCIFQMKPDGNIHNLVNLTDQLDNDYNQDCVLIRERTRPVNLAAQVTKLSIHSISNQEVFFHTNFSIP
jgi:hypothetical protein